MEKRPSPIAPFAGAILVAATFLSAASCATSRAIPGVPRGDPVIIGAVLPLTGDAAVFGASALNGMHLAIEEANEEGGALGRPLALIPRDDRGDPAEGAASFQASIDIDRAVAIAGAVMSKVSLAGAPICQARGVPMVSPTSTNPAVTEVGDHIFRIPFIDTWQAQVAARFAYDALDARTAACLYNDGNDYCVEIAETFRADFERRGGTIAAFAAHSWYPEEAADLVAELVAANPDVILLADYYHEAARLAVMARELGYTGIFLGPDGWDSPDFIGLGGDAVENSFMVNHWHPDSDSAESRRFVEAFTRRYGTAPDVLAECGYESVRVIVAGIRAAGTTKGAALRDAIATVDLALPTGRFRFGLSGDPIKSAAIITVREGKFEWFATVEPTGK